MKNSGLYIQLFSIHGLIRGEGPALGKDVEERIIKDAEHIITSTTHEIEKQYSLYNNFPPGSFKVIPPGIGVDTFG